MVNVNKKSVENIDLVIVPGLQLDDNWQLKQDLKNRLNKVIKLYTANPSIKIIVSGGYSIAFDWLGIKPRVLECNMMKQYLVDNGVSPRHIIREPKAKDSIGNVYYSKKIVCKHPFAKNILVVCATQHQPRVKFLFNKFFGTEYCVEYLTVKANESNDKVLSEEKEISDAKEFLKKVGTGYENDFKNQLYNSKFYQKSRLL